MTKLTKPVSQGEFNMKTFRYQTDAVGGVIEAEGLEEAFQILREEISDEEIENGATLWVEGVDGVRKTLGTNSI